MRDLLTVSEVARIFRVDDTTVRRWIGEVLIKNVSQVSVTRVLAP